MASVTFSTILAFIVLLFSGVQAAKLAVNQLSTPPIHPKAAGEVAHQVTSIRNLDLNCGLNFPSNVGSCLTSEEENLGNSINSYRASVGKGQLPFSKTLSAVAQAHAYDSATNSPASCGGNLHSWSGSCSTWSPVCYTPDHAQATGMWGKPSEFNSGFSGSGFEISAWNSGGMTASRALSQWQGSQGHNNVILENGSWGPFQSMGIGIYGRYAHVWFSLSSDPSGDMGSC